MTVRTCDLGELVGRVDAGSGQGQVLVAVSGFAATGKSTLARRLQERIDDSLVIGAMPYHFETRGARRGAKHRE